MIRSILAKLALPLLLCVGSFAQTTHTFTFGKFDTNSYTGGTVTGTAEMQTLDGNPANQANGYAGVIMVPYNESPYWGLQAPNGPYINPDGSYCLVGGTGVCSWGFPNNGDLRNNTTTPVLSAPVFTNPTCTLRTAGCVDYETGTANFVGYGQGVTVSVTVWFQVNVHHSCGRGGCHTYYTNDQTNGSGTAVFQ